MGLATVGLGAVVEPANASKFLKSGHFVMGSNLGLFRPRRMSVLVSVHVTHSHFHHVGLCEKNNCSFLYLLYLFLAFFKIAVTFR